MTQRKDTKDWKQQRLRFRVAVNPRASRRLDPDEAISFIPMESIGDDGSLTTSQTRKVSEVSSGYTYFEEDDVTVAKITPCFENGKGAVMKGLVGGRGFGTTELIVLRPDGETDPRFLYYATQTSRFRSDGEGCMLGSGGQKRISDAFVRDHVISWPPRAQQSVIADYLDREVARIGNLIAEKQRLIRLLREQQDQAVDRVLTPVPGGKSAKLGFFVDLLSGFAFPSSGFTDVTTDVRLLRGVNVSPGAIRWDDCVYWSQSESDRYERFRLEPGDVVFGMDRPWISSGARVAIVDEASAGALLLQRVCRLRGTGRIDQGFIYYALSSNAFRHSIEFELTGVSVPHISPEQILRFRIPIIPIEEQQSRCRAADDEIARLQALVICSEDMILRLQELRRVTIEEAVEGKIDVGHHIEMRKFTGAHP